MALQFLMCIDADPDRPEYGGARYDCPDKLTWNQLPALHKRLGKLRVEFKERHSTQVKFTWFIRADLQIKQVHGDAGWSARNFAEMWDKVSKEGDELAWHPHAWRWSSSSNCWYNDIQDSDYIRESYDVGFEAFKEVMGYPPRASRAGINFHNNDSMRKLDELGILTDLSGAPGLKLFYARPESGSPVPEGYDWSMAPSEPYRPSRDNYQKRAEGNDALRILEIPMTTWRRPFLSPSHLANMIPFDTYPRFRITRPPFKGWFVPTVWSDPSRFRRGLSEVIERGKGGRALYGSSLHPDDISDYTFARVRQNLELAVRMSEKRHVPLQFVTAGEAYISWNY